MSETKIIETPESLKKTRAADRRLILQTIILLAVFLGHWVLAPFDGTEAHFADDLNNISKEMADDVAKKATEFLNSKISMNPNLVCSKVDIFFLARNEGRHDICVEVSLDINQKITPSNTSITVLSIMVILLFISAIISIYDVLIDPRSPIFARSNSTCDETTRKYSLAEFVKAKHSRKESSVGVTDPIAVPSRPLAGRAASLCRYESVGSAFTRMRRDSVAQAAGSPMLGAGITTGNDTPSTPPTGSNRNHLKLFGGRPAPLLRRSSFPASALMDAAERRGSIDSEDDSSTDGGKFKRIRIIRRH